MTEVKLCQELKPCPFCGSEAALWEFPQATHTYINPKKTTYYKAKCMNPDCNVWHPSWDDPQVAIDRWNTRAERTCCLEPIPYEPGKYEGMRCSNCKTADIDMGLGDFCSGCGCRII